MIYDFNKDMIIEDTKIKNVSKMEKIMKDVNNQESIEMEKDERFSFFLNQNNNKNKKVKKIKFDDSNNKAKNKEVNNITKTIKNINNKTINKLNEEKLTEKKIYESLNKHKNEPSIKRLKFVSYFLYLLIVIFGIISIVLDKIYMNYLSVNLTNIKYTIFLSYYSHISIYYLRELILLNFNVDQILGGEYEKYPAKNKDEYRILIKEKLSQLFLDNQFAMKYLYSVSLPLNKNIYNIITKLNLLIKISSYKKVSLNMDILTSLMQYSSALFNIASSPVPIEQNSSDSFSYIYNNLNGYKKGINILINSYSNQLEIYNLTIIEIIIIFSIIIFIILVCFYTFIVINILASIQTRGNYMKVFYGINENIIKKIIRNCESLLNKLKSFEDQNYLDVDYSNDIDDKLTFENNKSIVKKEKSLYDNYNLNENNNEIKSKKNISLFDTSFIIFYGIFVIISFAYYEINSFWMIIHSRQSLIKNNICQRVLDIQITLIDCFNAYRELLFDNESMIDGLTSLEYLNKQEIEEIPTLNEKMNYIKINEKKIGKNISNISFEKSLCNYYINDLFDSSTVCEETIGLITQYDFNTLAIYFLEEIKIKKHILIYKLNHENILGNLTKYNYTEYINNYLIPRKWENNNNNIFRLNLFNNDTLHYELNEIFFSIILPYIEENRNKYFKILKFEDGKYNILSFNYLVLILLTLIFFCYIIPIINYVNKLIYKTKNMLSIIPLSILSFQSDALLLLNISNNK